MARRRYRRGTVDSGRRGTGDVSGGGRLAEPGELDDAMGHVGCQRLVVLFSKQCFGLSFFVLQSLSRSCEALAAYLSRG